MNWQDVLDTLDDWKANPGQCDEPGFDPPSDESLRRAKLLAENFRDRGEPGPLRIVPDGDGGIAFERRCEDHFIDVSVCNEGGIVVTLFADGSVVGTELWPAPDLPTGWDLSSYLTDGVDTEPQDG